MTAKKQMAANDERQYMLAEDYEIYEKTGAPVGATSLHYHDFYEILYIAGGRFDIYVEPSVYHLGQGDFLLIGRNQIHHYIYQLPFKSAFPGTNRSVSMLFRVQMRLAFPDRHRASAPRIPAPPGSSGKRK